MAVAEKTDGALAGMVVIDASRVLGGPYCGQVLADHGARVIKVEPPQGGDDARAYGPFVNGKSTYFASVNRGKESIALDLKADADRKIFEKLLEEADVLVENFRPGTLERWSLGYEHMRQVNPGVILLRVSAYGQTDLHNRMGFDHRNSLDVALHPDSPEGRALLEYLRSQGIPFLAFRGAIAGTATGPHVHIGRPSHRIR